MAVGFALARWLPHWRLALIVVEGLALCLFSRCKRVALFKSRPLVALWAQQPGAAEAILAIRDYLSKQRARKLPLDFSRARVRFPQVEPGEGFRLMEGLNCAGCHALRPGESPSLGPPPEGHRPAPPQGPVFWLEPVPQGWMTPTAGASENDACEAAAWYSVFR
ncbi:MAG: hypothetical protein ACE5JJ_03290 [Nitrospinota bacterium]